MKIYGNPKSDGFGLFCALIGGVFGLGAMAMTELSGLALPVALVVFGVLTLAMLGSLKRWDVMSEAPTAAGNTTGVPVRLPNFPVAAQSDSGTEASKPAWAADALSNATMLPQQVEQPKPAVETNALKV